MADPREIARGLSAEERALLIAWARRRGERCRSPDYPKSNGDELRVMQQLQARHLFVIEEEDDPDHGHLTAYFVTNLGRAVARELEQSDG